MAIKPRETPNLPATLKPGDFPLRSLKSRAAARNLLERRGDRVDFHIKVVGSGADPDCCCKACRRRWSKATPEERVEASDRLKSFLDFACGRTEKAPERAAAQAMLEERHQQKPSGPALHSEAAWPPVSEASSQSTRFAIMPPAKPMRRFLTGAARAFLRGDGEL